MLLVKKKFMGIYQSETVKPELVFGVRNWKDQPEKVTFEFLSEVCRH